MTDIEYEPIKVKKYAHDWKKDYKTYHELEPGTEMHFALHVIERWGMVAAIPDGEDSAGRAKLRMLTPEELVDRAMIITRKVFQRCKDSGWMRAPLADPVEEEE